LLARRPVTAALAVIRVDADVRSLKVHGENGREQIIKP